MSTPEIIPWPEIITPWPEIEPELRGVSFRQQITEWNEVTGAMNGYYNNECCYFADDADKMIAALSTRLRVAIEALEKRSEHYVCDGDCWFSCPASGKCCNEDRDEKCDCGAAEAREALASIGELKGEI